MLLKKNTLRLILRAFLKLEMNVINYNDDHRGEKVSSHRLLDDVDLTVSGEKKGNKENLV